MTVAQNIEYSGESGNAMIDLSVSAPVCRSGNHDGTVHVGSWESSNPFNIVREEGQPRFLMDLSCTSGCRSSSSKLPSRAAQHRGEILAGFRSSRKE